MGKPKSVDPVPILTEKSVEKKKEANKQKEVNICCWNIRRGLIIREEELKSLAHKNSLKIIFLVETDTYAVNVEEDFKIQGFKTLVQKKEKLSDVTRIICLIDENLQDNIIVRSDLSTNEFPSLWVELENNSGKNIICGGFYREWSPKGDKSIDAQVKAMQKFTNQIEAATQENKSIVILGDANLCNMKWDCPGFLHKKISDELRETLMQCGLITLQLGITYTADRLNEDGTEITSALDHIYVSNELSKTMEYFKLDNNATDHVPIVARVKMTNKKEDTVRQKTILKRTMKDFTKTRWLDCLRNRDWSEVFALQDVNKKTEAFTNIIDSALDECAPFKSFKVRQNFKPGLSETARKLIEERDNTRKKIITAKNKEKPLLKAKYKQLRNRTIAQIRKDTIMSNGEKINKAKNEGETWKIVNDLVKPKSHVKIVLTKPNGETSDEQEVADIFNTFFVKKISNLKEKIDPELIKDPLEKLKEKMKSKNLTMKIKTVTADAVNKLMKKMAMKKSKGKDGIPQDCLLLGKEVIAAPLTEVINSSIKQGTFPERWKEAIIVPILKKGDPKDPKNYRPVSCLPAASKVLEKVVCVQLTRYAEVHGLLPNNQHGFRAQRSTMTCLSSMQKEWVRNTEEKLTTGILVWDLSAAFDTLDIELLLKKLSIYGADSNMQNWFRSFLINRTQRVRIGESLSVPLKLESGVPQGGILSPMVFTLYTADMELWLKNSKLHNFADDTTTDTKGKDEQKIKADLEEDSRFVLQFMASNGLIANKAKTEFLALNVRNKNSHVLDSIVVGDVTVMRTDKTKLLGVMIDDAQDWTEHFSALRSNLNQRLFVIRRISRIIPRSKLINIVHSLWLSKLRYGLQLCLKVRLTEEDKTSSASKALQITQNRMMRTIDRTKIKDRVSVKYMLEKFNLLSVNQMAAKIKLLEVWKMVNREGSPLKLDPYNTSNNENKHGLRQKPNRVFDDTCRLKNSELSFHIDAARVWNASPAEIRNATSMNIAKTEVTKFCKTLPT